MTKWKPTKMEPMMEMWLEKANVLIEALPYIQRFHGKTIVVKYGGSAMVDHELKKSVIRDVALLKLVGFRPIIVHGGGKEITKWINKVGLETNFVNRSACHGWRRRWKWPRWCSTRSTKALFP